MYVLLREGYGFSDTREILVGKRVGGKGKTVHNSSTGKDEVEGGGTELGWSFGAGVKLAGGGGGLKCLA